MTRAEGSPTGMWTPANIVTLVRICLVPVFVVALLSPWPEWFGVHDIIDEHAKAIIAAGVFIVISCTDWIDGYLARSRNEVTDFGKLIDPLADKILVAAALIALVELQVMPAWPVLIILTREFIVSGIRMLAASKGFVIAASWYGKAKTVLQIVAIVLFIVKDSLYVPTFASVVDNPLYIVSWVVMLAALVMTILSMLDYISKARPLLFPKNQGVSQTCEEGDSADGALAEGTRDYQSLGVLAHDVIAAARACDIRLATAESLTGGMIAASLTSVPGSSMVVHGGAVTYVNEIKHKVLDVEERLLLEQGAVNEEVAREMAQGAAEKFDADLAVSVTGIAGPGGAEPGKPVGTVFMGRFFRGVVDVFELHFDGSREDVRRKTVEKALIAMRDTLEMI